VVALHREADLTGCGEILLPEELEIRVAATLLVGLDGGEVDPVYASGDGLEAVG